MTNPKRYELSVAPYGSIEGEWVRYEDIKHLLTPPEPTQLQEALQVAQQALLEVQHAQEVGANWYSKGADGLYQQVRMWVRRGQQAIETARSIASQTGDKTK